MRRTVPLLSSTSQAPQVIVLPGPEGSVHGESANFTGLDLGCIEAKIYKKIVENTHLKTRVDIYIIHSFAQLAQLGIRSGIKRGEKTRTDPHNEKE